MTDDPGPFESARERGTAGRHLDDAAGSLRMPRHVERDRDRHVASVLEDTVTPGREHDVAARRETALIPQIARATEKTWDWD